MRERRSGIEIEIGGACVMECDEFALKELVLSSRIALVDSCLLPSCLVKSAVRILWEQHLLEWTAGSEEQMRGQGLLACQVHLGSRERFLRSLCLLRC